MALYTLHDEPTLSSPVLIVALEGWIDAGGAAARAVEEIRDQSDARLVATFDADSLLDFRARRPTLNLVDGVTTGLSWPTTEMHALRSPNGTDVLLLSGAEPDHAWHAFCEAVVTLSIHFGCRLQVGLGAFPAGVPHTRPVQLSATASTEELATSAGFNRGTIDVPAGIEAALELRFDAAGLPAIGIWAQVPHYISSMRYPAAAARLLEGFNQVAGTDFALGKIAAESVSTRNRIDSLVQSNDQHLAMVRQLEESYDAQTRQRLGDLPSGDDLAAELERYLREQGDD